MVDDVSLQRAQELLGHPFSDLDLLRRALTHASTADTRLDSYERLEFLGDAVLGLTTCELIFSRYPDLLEGEMTKIKSIAVSRETCAHIAREMGLADLVALGKGMQGAALPTSLLAGVFEAVIGALYLDAGPEAARAFIAPRIEPFIERAYRNGHQQNFKSLLQQHAQQAANEPPRYLILDEKGPDHAKCFKVCVELAGRRFDPAWGPSKKQAEQIAARHALVTLGILTQDDDGQLVLVEDSETTSA